MNKQLRQLKRQIKNGNLAQSFLIVGPRYTGRKKTVFEVVKEINNLSNHQLSLAQEGGLPDVMLIQSETDEFYFRHNNKVHQKKVNSIDGENRNLTTKNLKDSINKEQIDNIIKKASLKNFQLEYKVVIIENAQKLTQQAGNGLLKLIEEPREKLLIFLLVGNEDEVLGTIKSRCQLIRFSFVSAEREVNYLKDNFAFLKDDDLKIITSLSRGRLILAERYARDIEVAKKMQEDILEFRKALRGSVNDKIALVDKVVANKELWEWILNEWIWYLKVFLEKNIREEQPRQIISKIYQILKRLVEVVEILRSQNVSKKIQLENFFVQI